MNALYKRRFLKFIIALVLLATLLTACNGTAYSEKVREDINSFSVSFIDVGEADSTFIHFPDGKNVLIDCGAGEEVNNQKILTLLKNYNVKKIDLLILTNPLQSRIGGVTFILDNFTVEKALVPYVFGLENYPLLSLVVDKLTEKNVSVSYNEMLKGIKSDEYLLSMLIPRSRTFTDSAYYPLIGNPSPTEQQIKNISPVIYLEYMGVRFLLSGDANKTQEQALISYYQSGYYDLYSRTVALEDIDFYKCADHGDADANSEELLSILKPKTAVISVGGNNSLGHPSTQTLNRLITANANSKIVRTDTVGTFTVKVTDGGEIFTFNEIN